MISLLFTYKHILFPILLLISHAHTYFIENQGMYEGKYLCLLLIEAKSEDTLFFS